MVSSTASLEYLLESTIRVAALDLLADEETHLNLMLFETKHRFAKARAQGK